MKFEVKVILGEKEVVAMITEEEAEVLFHKIQATKVKEFIVSKVEKLYPLARKLLAENYDTIIENIVYEILDVSETEDINWKELREDEFIDIINNQMTSCNEVKNDFFDENEECYTIDVWKTNDDNEEGIVVAKVYLDNSVSFIDDNFKTDIEVLMAIDEVKTKIQEE